MSDLTTGPYELAHIEEAHRLSQVIYYSNMPRAHACTKKIGRLIFLCNEPGCPDEACPTCGWVFMYNKEHHPLCAEMRT